MRDERKASRKAKIQQLGLWIEPEIFNKQWNSQQRAAHIEKIKQALGNNNNSSSTTATNLPNQHQFQPPPVQQIEAMVAQYRNKLLIEANNTHQSQPQSVQFQ